MRYPIVIAIYFVGLCCTLEVKKEQPTELADGPSNNQTDGFRRTVIINRVPNDRRDQPVRVIRNGNQNNGPQVIVRKIVRRLRTTTEPPTRKMIKRRKTITPITTTKRLPITSTKNPSTTTKKPTTRTTVRSSTKLSSTSSRTTTRSTTTLETMTTKKSTTSSTTQRTTTPKLITTETTTQKPSSTTASSSTSQRTTTSQPITTESTTTPFPDDYGIFDDTTTKPSTAKPLSTSPVPAVSTTAPVVPITTIPPTAAAIARDLTTTTAAYDYGLDYSYLDMNSDLEGESTSTPEPTTQSSANSRKMAPTNAAATAMPEAVSKTSPVTSTTEFMYLADYGMHAPIPGGENYDTWWLEDGSPPPPLGDPVGGRTNGRGPPENKGREQEGERGHGSPRGELGEGTRRHERGEGGEGHGKRGRY